MEIFRKIDEVIVKNISLDDLGFIHLDYILDYNTGVFYQETKDKVNVIRYGFAYDYREYDPIEMAKEGFKSWISFKSVEKIMEIALSNRFELEGYSNAHEFNLQYKTTISNNEVPNISNETFFYTMYKNKQLLFDNILESIKQVKVFISEYHLSYFEKFSTLQDVNDKIIENHNWLDWKNFFFKDTYFKAIIIMKLCNNDKKYIEFTTMYRLRISQAIEEGNNDLLSYYDDLIKVINYLDSGAYKNIVD